MEIGLSLILIYCVVFSSRMGGLKGDWTESELKMLLESYMENDSKKEVLRLVQSNLATQGFRKSKEAILAQLFAQQLLPEQNLQELITCNSVSKRNVHNREIIILQGST